MIFILPMVGIYMGSGLLLNHTQNKSLSRCNYSVNSNVEMYSV